MADISPTLSLIDSAIGSADSARGNAAPAPPISGSQDSGPVKSAADHAIDVLQLGIDRKLPDAAKPYETTNTSRVLNTESGANSALASTLGAPVDLATGAVNLGIRGVNAVAGHPVANELGDLPGGAKSIKSAMGLIHANPDNVVPQNQEERIFHGVGEGIGSAVALPLGAEGLIASKVISPAAAPVVRSALGAPDALNATIGAAAGAGSTIAADAVPEPYKPIAATVGGLVGGAPVVAIHGAAEGARAALEGLRNHVTEEGARRTVAREMAGAATDAARARENLRSQPHEIVPGSTGTTGQIAGDTGLLNWERGVRQNNAAEFNDREASQNTARIAHLESVQPSGNAADLPGVIAGQREAVARTAATNTGVVDALSAGSVRSAEGAQKSALEGLAALKPDASPADVSAHFREVRDALEASHGATMDAAEREAETARTASAPNAQSPEQVGQNLRAPAEAARATAKESVDRLYKALPDDIEAPSADIAAKAKEIKGSMLPEHAPMEGEEARLFGLAKNYGDQAPLANLNALRSSILTEKANVKRTSPQAYGRLTQLQNAVENAIDHGIESRAALDQVAVRRGTMTAEDALPARINQTFDDAARQNPALEVRSGRDGSNSGRSTGGNAGDTRSQSETDVGSGNAPGREGLSPAPGRVAPEADRAGAPTEVGGQRVGDSVFTPSGRKIGVAYRVVDASELKASNNPDMSPNKDYPQELQPRDRSRAASETQVAKIASGLQPERLGPSTSASEGAPIIGPDHVVESGNGRVLGIRRAYAQNGDAAQNYRDYLQRQGFDTTGMKEPVLVRQRTTELNPEERARFTQESNAGAGLSLSPSERAAIDSHRIPDDALNLYQGGDVASAANRDFVKSFMKNVPEHGEEGNLATADGSLSLEGGQRIRNALLHAAYGDSNLVSSLAETGDEEIKAFGNVLTDAAGRMSQLRRGIASGRIDPGADLAGPMLEAARVVQRAKMNGSRLSDIVAQKDAFNRISDEAHQLLQIAYGPNFTGRLSRDNMRKVIDAAASEAVQQTTDARLFGEPIGASEILKTVNSKYGKSPTANVAPDQLALGAPVARPGNGESGQRSAQPDLGSERNQGAAARAQQESPKPFQQVERSPSSAPIEGNPLREANAAYKDLKRTFDEGPVGDITGKNGRGQYDLSPAELTRKVFHPGDTGGEDVRAYVKAVGPDQANAALSDAAAHSLHEKTTRPDGTLDPKKVDSWLSAHKTAITELPPETRTKFENAASAQRAVEDAFAARRDALNAHDKSEAGKIMGLKDPGDIVREVGGIIGAKDGARRMGDLATAAKDNPAAHAGLQRAIVEHVMNKFLPDGLEKARGFIADKSDVLEKVFSKDEIAGISGKLQAAQTAGAKLESAKANRESALKEAQASEKEALGRYDSTILGKIMKTEGSANVLDKLGTVFGSSDSARQMGLLAEEAAKVSGGTEALRKAVTEMIRRDYSGTAEVATSGEKGLSRAALDKFMRENTQTLEKVLSPDQVGKLKAIVDDQLRANRSITATKLKGGSDTNQNQIASGKSGSILSMLAKQATEVGGTVIGSLLGGPGGAVVGNIGAKASAALRDAGLNRLSEIRIRAALDPQFGKALLDEVPKYPDRNAAALVALRARQLSVAGAMAGVRQSEARQ
jgi:hypothetical protein